MVLYYYIMSFFYDQVPYVLTVAGIVAAATLFSCVVVGRVLRSDEIKEEIMSKDAEEAMKKRIAQRKYEQSFYDELEALDDDDLTKGDMEKLSSFFITEETPLGDIKMCYSCETETFWYYSANKNIPYPTLDAVARQYAITYNCAKVCVNYRKEMERMRERRSNKTVAASNDDKNTSSVYVKFKSYNKPTASEKNMVTVERSNRFTYKGVISDNEEASEDNADSTIKKLSFAEYKKSVEYEKLKTL